MTIPSGFAQVNLLFTGAALPTGAEMTFAVEPGGDVLSPGVACTVVSAAWNDAHLIAEYVNDVTLSTIRVKFGPDDTGPFAELGVAYTGQQVDDPLPPNVAVLVHKRTLSGGRSGRGRMYFPGAAEQDVGPGGALVPLKVTNMTAALDNFRANLANNDLPMVLLHRPGAPLSTPTPVVGLDVAPLAATQRRRLRR